MRRPFQSRRDLRRCMRQRTAAQMLMVAVFLGVPLLLMSLFLSLDVCHAVVTAVHAHAAAEPHKGLLPKSSLVRASRGHVQECCAAWSKASDLVTHPKR